MRVIFLDVDGVLANSRSKRSPNNDSKKNDAALIYDPLGKQPPLEKRCIRQLARVLSEAKADGVVLTTMWRHYPPKRKFLVSALETEGIPVLGDTPGGPGRGAEVQMWLTTTKHKHNPQKKKNQQAIVIFDDQHRQSYEKEGFQDKLVQTILMDKNGDETQEGITKEKADAAIAILRKQESSSTPPPSPQKQVRKKLELSSLVERLFNKKVTRTSPLHA